MFEILKLKQQYMGSLTSESEVYYIFHRVMHLGKSSRAVVNNPFANAISFTRALSQVLEKIHETTANCC